jgi:hypothetical protein
MTAVVPATNVVDRPEFVRRLGERFPNVAAQIDDVDRGLLHLEMAVFARATAAAIEAGSAILVADFLAFADEILGSADSAVENAIYVSYLENIFLGETREVYLHARRKLPPRLARGLIELEEHFERLAEAAAKRGQPKP